MNETATIADQWLYETLTAALGHNRVYEGVAREGTTPPWVVFSEIAAFDAIGVGDARILVDAVYLVRAVGPFESWTPLLPTARIIDQALHGAKGTTDDGEVFTCRREEPSRLAENDGGKQYRHLGGRYRLLIQAII